MSKIALSVGTRAESVQASVTYEIPKEVVTEAIVNAVAHRDYTDNSSVQVMLFADRLEVLNSGRLPPPLTVDRLRLPHQSLPGNPLLAESMYLLQYIERMGTGTVDMIRRCAEAGLPEPEFEVGAGFLIRIWRSGDGKTTQRRQKTARKPPEKEGASQKLGDRILAFLRRNPSASRRDIVETIHDATEGSVRHQLDKLKKLGELRRVGPARGGRWLVVDDLDARASEETGASAGDRRHAGEAQSVISQDTTRKPPESHQKTARTSPQSAEPPALLRPHSGASQPEPVRQPSRDRRHARHHRIHRPIPAGQVARVRQDRAGRSRQGRLLEGVGRFA